jgi:hypothetical protein
MVTIICSESKLEFEAETRRTKQHPRIANLKSQADKNGNYREVNAALAEARKRGGYTTIDEFMALVQQIVTEKQEQARAMHDRIAASRRREEEMNAQIKAEREARKAKIKAAGYKWLKDDYEEGNVRWDLFSPDGRIVTEQQALDEIERGADVVLAEIAENEKAAEVQRVIAEGEERRIQEAERDALAHFDSLVDRIEAANQRIERITFDVVETIRIQWPEGRKHSYYRHIDEIERGQINGVDCWSITTGSGYDDDGYTSYYCADPTKAGATIAAESPDDDLSATFGEWFG